MKIKKLFFILLIGIFLIPILSIAIMTSMVYYRSVSRIIPIGSARGGGALFSADSSGTQSEQAERYIRDYLNDLPYDVDCVAVSGKGRILYSEMEELHENAVVAQDAFRDFIFSGSDSYFYSIDTNLSFLVQNGLMEEGGNPLENDDFLFFITRIPKRDAEKGPPPVGNFFLWFIVASEAILLFAIILSVFIIRLITTSIEKLKDAAETLEAGNLDKEIKLKATNEIMTLADCLDRMRLGLKKDKIRNSNFIIGLSHDLRTPIALIKGYTEAIKDDMSSDPEFLENALSIIADKTSQLAIMLDSLIDSVRIENSEWKGSLSKCMLNSWLSTFAERISADGNLLGKSVNTEISLPANLFMLVDEEILTRFLENILGNAFRYTQEGGAITFAASWEPYEPERKERRREQEKKGKNGVMKIIVADNGIGISEQSLPFIFDAFYKEANSRRGEGHGFGLAIVKHIADTYGWDITVDSKKGEGTVFTVLIYDCEYAGGQS